MSGMHGFGTTASNSWCKWIAALPGFAVCAMTRAFASRLAGFDEPSGLDAVEHGHS
jgi:hypothetical protein